MLGRACRWLGRGWSPGAGPGGILHRGSWLRRCGYVGHAGSNVFCWRVLENRGRPAYDPVNARSTMSLRTRLGLGWVLGGQRETSAHPDAEWTLFQAVARFGQGMGSLTQNAVRRWERPEGEGEPFSRCNLTWRLPYSRDHRERQSLQLRVGRHSQSVNPRPNGETAKVLVLFVQSVDIRIDD